MDKKEIIVLFINHRTNKQIDLEVPLNITANELIVGLNAGLNLGLDTDNLYQCSLSIENPIVLLHGNRTLQDFGLRDGSIIHFV